MDRRIVPDWLGRRAVINPQAPAVAFAGQVWSFGDLDRAAALAAGGLAARGVRAGDRVAILAHNGPGFVVAVHAAVRTGAVLVPLNVRLTAEEIAWQLRDSGATLLLQDRVSAGKAAEAATEAGGVPLAELDDTGRLLGPTGHAVAGRAIDLDRVQGIVYTSGTTGRPKGAQLTFGNWWFGAAASALHLGQNADDRWLATLPLFHVGGLAILFRSAIGGIPVSMLDGFDPEEVVAVAHRDRATMVSVVAATLRRLLDVPWPPDALASLRVALLGGGPAPAALVREAIARGVPIAPTYGLTEAASQVATLPPGRAWDLPGCAGQPLPHVDLVILSEDGDAPDGVGEIAIRGPGVMRGYLGESPVADGWFRTGDIGRLEYAGRLYVLDRRDDLIISGGENVYPAEVEAALLAHPAVMEAAVVGACDETWGSVPVAFVVPRPGAAIFDGSLATATRSLAPYKRPRRLIQLDALPRNAAGKVLRGELRRRLELPSAGRASDGINS